jgi:hypothetical protein
VHDGVELIPRPEQNPAALKAALAVVAADRLPEMTDGQMRAMAEAISTGSVQPIRSFVAHRAAAVEITAGHYAEPGPAGGSSEDSQWAPFASLGSDLGLRSTRETS